LSGLADQGLVTCEEIPQDGKPDRKVYAITPDGRQFLLDALKNPSPCHKVRSEFLAMMCFAHLMPVEDVQAVLDNRLADIEQYKDIFKDIESSCESAWPPGMKFVLGFGKAMSAAMEKYINDNRDLLTQEQQEKTATG